MLSGSSFKEHSSWNESFSQCKSEEDLSKSMKIWICCGLIFPWFKLYFPVFWVMVIYQNKFVTKEIKFKLQIKLNHCIFIFSCRSSEVSKFCEDIAVYFIPVHSTNSQDFFQGIPGFRRRGVSWWNYLTV